MRIIERTRWRPLWVGLALVLLAGVLSMHALAPHDGSMRWMGPGPVDHRLPDGGIAEMKTLLSSLS